MLPAIIAAFTTLLQQALPLVLNAASAKKEEHAQIIADLQAAVTAFQTTLGNVQATIAADDAAIDAEVTKVEATPPLPVDPATPTS